MWETKLNSPLQPIYPRETEPISLRRCPSVQSILRHGVPSSSNWSFACVTYVFSVLKRKLPLWPSWDTHFKRKDLASNMCSNQWMFHYIIWCIHCNKDWKWKSFLTLNIRWGSHSHSCPFISCLLMNQLIFIYPMQYGPDWTEVLRASNPKCPRVKWWVHSHGR